MPPPILEDLDLIRVHGWYGKINGEPAVGVIEFRPNVLLKNPRTGAQILPVTFVAELDGNGRIHTPPRDGEPGHLGVDLPATDDPDLYPQGWTYTVTYKLGPSTILRQPEKFELSLSHELAGGTFDLVDAEPSRPPSPGQVLYVPDAVFRAWVPSDGAAGQVLTRDAAGGASWQDPTGGGGGGVTPSQLAAAIDAHDEDGGAHDDIRQALAGKADVDDPRLSDARTPTAHTHTVADLDTTGTASETTFLRGDGTWAAPPGGGGGGGVTDHGDLTGRSDADQHPIGAITGLASALDGKAGVGEPAAAVAAHDADTDAHPDLRSRIGALEDVVPAFGVVAWDDDNDAARPDALVVYWQGWPAELVPTNAAAGDLIFTPDDD